MANIVRDSVKTTGVNFIAQFGSFIISAIVAALYGATSNTDIYFYGLSIVLIFTSAIGGILKSVFISVFHRYIHKEKADEKEILGSFYLFFISFLLFLWVIFVSFSLFGLKFVSIPGIQDNQMFARVLFQLSFLIIFSGFVDCFSTLYNSYQHFVAPLLTPLLRSVVFITFVFYSKDSLGVESLSIGTALSELVQLTALFLIIRLKGIYFGFKFSFHPAVRKMVKLSLPPFLSNATTRINNFIDGAFVAPLLIGGVTVLNYSNKIASIPEIFLTGGILTVILSYWSLERSKNGVSSLEKNIKKALISITFVVIPMVIFMFVLRVPLVEILYQRKNFTPDLTQKTALLLGLYSFGLLPLILGRVLTRGFLVLEDTWTPFWVGNIRLLVNFFTNVLFIKIFGFPGIAISTSVTSLLLFTFMFLTLKRKIKMKNVKDLFVDLGKLIIIGVISSLLVFLIYNLSQGILIEILGRFFGLLFLVVCSSTIGFIFYVFLSFLFKVSVVLETITLIKLKYKLIS